MSGIPTPSVKASRWQQVLAHLAFRDRASSPSSSPSPQSNQNVTSSTAQITNPSSTQTVSLSTASAGPVLSDLLTAGAAPLSLPQESYNPSSNTNLLRDVLKRLSDNDRATLEEYMSYDASDINSALEQALAATKEKQRCCIKKRWTFTLTGRTVVLKEEADKPACDPLLIPLLT